jgi:hypothetical protein
VSKGDLAASVRQRLLNRSKSEGRPFQELLQYYAMERFLYRLAISPHGDRFILKGALILVAWQAPQSRPTVDIDLEGRLSNDLEIIREVIKDVCQIESIPDGIHFDTTTIQTKRIKEDADYAGVRGRFDGSLARARIRMQLDVGFGDVIVPKPSRLEYPTILDFPAPVLLAYPRETVIAEKLEALTTLGMLNSRIKDYFDIWLLSRLYPFNGILLAEAIAATFRNRSTPIEARPIGLTESFSNDPTKLKQWAAFRRLHRSVTMPEELRDLVSSIAIFCLPVLSSLADHKAKFMYDWKRTGPWQQATG